MEEANDLAVCGLSRGGCPNPIFREEAKAYSACGMGGYGPFSYQPAHPRISTGRRQTIARGKDRDA